MSAVPDWKVPKWPFLLANAVLIAAAAALIYILPHPISTLMVVLASSVVALGAVLGCLPFFLDYFAMGKMIDVHAVTSVAEQLNDLKEYSAKISIAADQWARVQEVTKGHTDKTVTAAGQIADRMVTEIRDFNEFQLKLNDTEKGALRLEVEKLRRTEGDWIQVMARVLDNVFMLYAAASQSGKPEVIEQIGAFQNVCLDSVRRVGLGVFGVEANEKFDPKRHRAQGVEKPVDGTPIVALIAPGMTFQGRLIRPALVALAGKQEPATENAPPNEPATEPAQDQLTLEADQS